MEAMAAGLAGMGANAHMLRESITSGDVQFTQEAADALSDGVRSVRDALESCLRRANALGQEPAIGQTRPRGCTSRSWRVCQ